MGLLFITRIKSRFKSVKSSKIAHFGGKIVKITSFLGQNIKIRVWYEV
eukprot:UN22145